MHPRFITNLIQNSRYVGKNVILIIKEEIEKILGRF